MDTQRESMDFDVLIIGAGPAGLSCAIRLAQMARQQERELNICVLEKGAYVGAHIVSGAVLEPIALNELIPNWQELGAPVKTAVTQDAFYWLSKSKSKSLPTPLTMKNEGNYIISLGKLCEWLGEKAESMGVNIFPGFAADKILYDCDDSVTGVQTKDMGLNADGTPGDRYEPGMNLYAKHTVIAEGCRGSLAETLISKFDLRKESDPQTYGIGIKEVWQIDPSKHKLGRVVHTIGWPLDNKTYGGSFIYHAEDNKISLGFVIGLDYQNPYLNPFKEFQRFKTHPMIKELLEGGECVGYGARALNEGGLQSIPKLTFPGGLLIGCSAGFLNVAKIKGNHTAMKSGMLAAESIFSATELELKNELTFYTDKVKQSYIYKELYKVRNVRAYFHKGLLAGLIGSAIDQYLFRGNTPWTLHYTPDHSATKPKVDFKPIDYPKPDGKLTFDCLSQVFLTSTEHNEKQPCHLKLKDPSVPININLPLYDAPEQRYCPANVYEIVENEDGPALQINFTNCIHCKTCDIKDPTQNIVWTTPEGGDGPNYQGL